MGMGFFGARSLHDFDFKTIWLRQSVLFRLALLESIFCSYSVLAGGVAEWLNAPVLKTDVGESLPWVRIPPPPP